MSLKNKHLGDFTAEVSATVKDSKDPKEGDVLTFPEDGSDLSDAITVELTEMVTTKGGFVNHKQARKAEFRWTNDGLSAWSFGRVSE